MAKECDRSGEIMITPLQLFFLKLDLATRRVVQKNIQAACHDRRHRAADPRNGRTERRHRFGKKKHK